jgi:hypothetical protein
MRVLVQLCLAAVFVTVALLLPHTAAATPAFALSERDVDRIELAQDAPGDATGDRGALVDEAAPSEEAPSDNEPPNDDTDERYLDASSLAVFSGTAARTSVSRSCRFRSLSVAHGLFRPPRA